MPIYATPGYPFSTVLQGAISWADPHVRVDNLDGSVNVARTKVGVVTVETGSGIYSKTFTVPPSVAGTYVVLWDDGNSVVENRLYASEELIVGGGVIGVPEVVGSPLNIYTTVGELMNWLADNGHAWTSTVEELARVIHVAESDIDHAAGIWPMQANGRKFGDPSGLNEVGLTLNERVSLSRATCAQAEYRLQMGTDFFIEHQRQSASGPDGLEVGKVSKLGPLAQRELITSGLPRLTGRFR